MIIDSTMTSIEVKMQEKAQLFEDIRTEWGSGLHRGPRSEINNWIENGTHGHEDNPTVLVSERHNYERKINGKYLVPNNAIQISANTFVTKRPGNTKKRSPNDKTKSCMHAWHPSYGLSHGVSRLF